ncbi:phenylalanyl-tRNA synthetase beta chain [Lebetimonas natsushimae]|uniref:Phenylalanine--tRNA ligase beta subunit n=1 Tax=Lebetimonas natsushimae TaxID=1936991 RepID=A0A292YFH5_9BACT|nr:phenylalanine--tRNA ligase subunit beta [Lebetimonas natsushimae]GAX88188.1 phenylalanyl-tRNA synthetase beta chain [Lebetimonas natsushimae]
MIVTRKWLEEFINLDGISTDEIIKALNSIGNEVEGYKKIEIPENVVIGEVIECEKHPNADKLNVCKVNVGDETLQIVCGAKNVAAGQYVVVSKVGACLPEIKIKKAKLRGIESNGMICAAREIGLPDFHEGIMVLDNSLGELKIGEYAGNYFNDEIIELGITPNRGDCFSIYGIARELAAAFNKDIVFDEITYEEIPEGIGRVVKFDKTDIKHSSHLIKAFNGTPKSNVKIKYRLSLCEIDAKDDLDEIVKYAIHATGVLLVPSDIKGSFEEENGVDILKTSFGIYRVGIKNDINLENPSQFIIDANYIDPEYVSEIVYKNKLKTDEYFYRASRGSEPDLELGINYFIKESKLKVYSSEMDFVTEKKPLVLNVSSKEICKIIGENISENKMVEILKKLGFVVEIIGEDVFRVKVPEFRPDIKNIQDISEEILRIYGIDKIKSAPLVFEEKDRTNEVIKKLNFINELKLKAVANGFYEVIHFIFDDKERLKKYGFEILEEKLDLANPIVNELSTLRSTLLLQLLDDVKRNRANGYKVIQLFSIGSVYNKNREETTKLAFVMSGNSEFENVKNQGKPRKVEFKDLVDKLAQVIGEFKLVENENYPLVHPYQSASIIKNGIEIGVIAKLHPKVQKDFELDETVFAEIDLDRIKNNKKEAKEINKFPKVTRDLSIVIDKNTTYKEIFEIIDNLKIKELVDFYPIDIYDMQQNYSLTIRFVIQGKKTLTDNEINDIMQKILNSLEERGFRLR